jgi:hypothetical protein
VDFPEIAMLSEDIHGSFSAQVTRQADEKGEEFIDYDPEDLFLPGVGLGGMGKL